MRQWFRRYRILHSSPGFYVRVGFAVLLFIGGIVCTYWGNNYAAAHTGRAVNDIFLDSLPVYNVDDVFFEGTLLFIGFVCVLGFHRPHRIPFILESSAVFMVIRSFFIILTHLSPPEVQSMVLTNTALERLIAGSGHDLFFSGHTGFPFLMAMVFWPNWRLRTIFLLTSGVFAVAVLLGHLHYSIDVFSAFFITYSIFHLTRWLFAKDYALLLEATNTGIN